MIPRSRLESAWTSGSLHCLVLGKLCLDDETRDSRFRVSNLGDIGVVVWRVISEAIEGYGNICYG